MAISTPTRRFRRPNRLVLNRWFWTAFFLGPGIIYFAIFHWLPVIQTVIFSTQQWSLLTMRAPNRPFVGLSNYQKLLTDPVFWASARNTVVYTIFVVGLTVCLGLLIALALQSVALRLQAPARAIIFLPVMVSMVGAAVIWKWLFDYHSGLVNYMLSWVGIHAISWLNDPPYALPAVIITSLWKQLGFAVVIFMAGLLQVPTHLYEAAAVDGAGPFQRFRHVTIPMLQATIALVTVTQMITALQVFTQVFVMTEGGPGDATRTLVQYVYEQGFTFYAMGKATALGLILMVVILLVSTAQLRILSRGGQE